MQDRPLGLVKTAPTETKTFSKWECTKIKTKTILGLYTLKKNHNNTEKMTITFLKKKNKREEEEEEMK